MTSAPPELFGEPIEVVPETLPTGEGPPWSRSFSQGLAPPRVYLTKAGNYFHITRCALQRSYTATTANP